MADQSQPEQKPEEKFRQAMQRILTVSKPEILKREAEDRERRQKQGQQGDDE